MEKCPKISGGCPGEQRYKKTLSYKEVEYYSLDYQYFIEVLSANLAKYPKSVAKLAEFYYL